MSFLTSAPGPWTDHPVIYVALATVVLLIALRFVRWALSPFGAIAEAVFAIAVAAVAVALALALLAAVILSSLG
jgi:hypothetical protein